ncbi:MAG: hypothetical protein Q8L27_03335 [archaeon]|nr:hypothetical protein [archaeon]
MQTRQDNKKAGEKINQNSQRFWKSNKIACSVENEIARKRAIKLKLRKKRDEQKS